jgi:hypothetical protein
MRPDRLAGLPPPGYPSSRLRQWPSHTINTLPFHVKWIDTWPQRILHRPDPRTGSVKLDRTIGHELLDGRSFRRQRCSRSVYHKEYRRYAPGRAGQSSKLSCLQNHLSVLAPCKISQHVDPLLKGLAVLHLRDNVPQYLSPFLL